MKRNLLFTVIVTVLIMAFLMSACSPSTAIPDDAKVASSTFTQSESSDKKTSSDLKKVVYVTPGTLGDNGFTDSVWAGLQRIKDDYGAEVKIIENGFDSSKYAQSVEAAFAWGPNVLFTDAYGMEEVIKTYSEQYPNVQVINLDFVLENKSNTISSITFIQEEGSFMAGVVAALITTSDLPFSNPEKVVGAMGGVDMWVIRSFMHGYEQGVKYLDPEIKIVINFAGTFSDPVTGKTASKQLFAQDADIVFQIAGLTGSGVLEAAFEEGKYAIGVDSNQNFTYPGHIVTSMVKDLNGAAYEIYKMLVEGTFEKGKTYENGYGYAGTYLAIDKYTEEILTSEMLEKVREIENKLKSGDITVSRYPKE